ncbi:hypothetical protein DND132_2649 [Pseudodesulfovibrio mercurii]|uniref:Uncharacterized protein n=1 Tax=Pseudodesulfovibrio mercurii TaxID=641491 RepID=F0JIV3_9BACT|nr:hypothetical protein [Pseudodesulfovibrio mercurii]EGB15852.1 hypothetical protein DND132_2649 [Pseudodesulfovibrio mercurii]
MRDREPTTSEIIYYHVEHALGHFQILIQSIIGFASGAIRGATLLNGGAAVALLGFLASNFQLRNNELLPALQFFVAGALFASVTWVFSYLSQICYAFDLKYRWNYSNSVEECLTKKSTFRKAAGCLLQLIGMAFMITSYGLFAWGCFTAYDAIQKTTLTSGL